MTVTELAAKAIIPSPPSVNGDEDEEVPEPGRIKPVVQRQLTSKKGSMLAISDDPFAPREGKTLLWRNVNMTLVRAVCVCVCVCVQYYVYFTGGWLFAIL
jgi:hypothetical protein